MSKHPLRFGWCRIKPRQLALATVLLMASVTVAGNPAASAKKVAQAKKPVSSQVRSQKAIPVRATSPNMTEPSEQIDPLDSPHPVPWNWVMATYDQVSSTKGSGIRYFRTQSLVSPDGKYATYSRIQIHVQPELYRSRVSSVMFVENLTTGELRVVTASSPLANNPNKKNEAADKPGVISILIPVSWSTTGDRLLARQFEGSFSASDASDYAVVWDKRRNRTSTVSPNNVEYDQATLLGWSKADPDRVIFRAGELGDEQPKLWAVNLTGQTVAAKQDQPVVFGRTITHAWAGPQASY